MRLRLIPPLLVLALASVRAEAPPVKGTLPEDYLPGLVSLLKASVERSPNTVLSDINVAQQEAQRYLYAAALWPQLNANMYYGWDRESVSHSTGTTQSGLYYYAGLSQPIFQWGALKNNAAIGALGIKIAQRQFDEAYRMLAVDIRRQYMYLIGKQIQLRNARYRQKIAEEALKTDQAKFDSGSASEAELQGFKLALEQAQLDTDRSEEDFSYSKRVLMRTAGVRELPDESIPLEIGHPEYSAAMADGILNGFVGGGVESAFQSEVYALEMKQQDLSYKIAKVRLLPKFYLNATYSVQNQTNAFAGSVLQEALTNEAYQVGANWQIFDGFATRGAKLGALETKRYFERMRQTYIDSSVDQMTDMRHQLGFLARALSLSEVHHALIGAEVKRIQDDVRLGYASEATIETSMLNLYATDVDLAGSRTSYLEQWSEFVSLAGIDPVLENLPPRYAR